MRDHDLELIAALAEGRLEDESEALALVASSEEARAEFEVQSRAIRALSGMSPVGMSETERATLHRDLWTELRAPSQTSAPTPASPWYYRWMPVAAGMFILVGLLTVLSQGGIDGLLSAGQSASETTSAGTETSDALAEESDRGDDSVAGEADGETLAEPSTTMAAADSGDGDVVDEMPPAAAFYSAEAEEIRTGDEPISTSMGEFSMSEIQQCLEEAGYGDYSVREVNATPEETAETGEEVPDDAVPYLAATPFGDELAEASVVFVALESCEVIHVDE